MDVSRRELIAGATLGGSGAVASRRVAAAGQGATSDGQPSTVRVVEAVPAETPRNWPVETDVPGDTCRNAAGVEKPTTGAGSARWVVWNGCGTWKEFAVVPGETVYLEASTDAALLDDARFRLLERVNGSWEPLYEHTDALGDDASRVFEIAPRGDRLRVENRGQRGFYVELYGPTGATDGSTATSGEGSSSPEPTPGTGDAGADDPLVPSSLGLATWAMVLVIGMTLVGALGAYQQSVAGADTTERANEDWREMRHHPDVEETVWSSDDLPEYAVDVDGRRVVARRQIEDGDPHVTVEMPLTAVRPGAGMAVVERGGRPTIRTAGPLAPDLPENVWRRLAGLDTLGTLTVDDSTATVEHDLTDADPDALRSPDELVAQATAVAAVAGVVEDSVE